MKTLSASSVDTALFSLLSENATATDSEVLDPNDAFNEIEEGNGPGLFLSVKEELLKTIPAVLLPEVFFSAYSESPYSDDGTFFVRTRTPEGRDFLFLVFLTNSLALSVEALSGPNEDEAVEIITPAYRKEGPDGGEGYFFFRTAFSCSGTSRPDPRFYSVTVPLFY